jgi:predicted O-methyltransferase YrrM
MIAVCVGLLVCAAVYVYSAEEGKMSAEAREEFLKNFKHRGLDTTRGDAMMLRILVEGSKAKRGVEVGTFVGFGAMNMGIGFERTGGHLYTLEINPKSAAEAKANLTKLGLDKTVTVIEGDALKTLSTLEGEFDFVFLDAAKNQCGQYLKLLEPKLKPGAIVAADNVIKSAADMKDFLDYVENSPNYDTVTIRASMEKQDGMTVSYKKQ